MNHEDALKEAKDNVPRGASDYALRVLVAWFNAMDAPVAIYKEQPCPDCGDDKRLFYTRSWHGLCPPCTLSRMENDGRNTRKADVLGL